MEGPLKNRKWTQRLSLALAAILTAACHGGSGGSSGGSPTSPSAAEPTYDVVGRGIPQFVDKPFIPLASIDQISRFRSSVGHSYTDATEGCRSMKHYFAVSGSAVSTPLASPVDGTVRSLDAESNGVGRQLAIQPTAQPAFRIIVFHVPASTPLTVGAQVSAGQPLGSVAAFTLADVAVGVNTPEGYRLVSWFDVITEALFQEYRAAGVAARADAIISRAARDADPITCSGETFRMAGTLRIWVALNGHVILSPNP